MFRSLLLALVAAGALAGSANAHPWRHCHWRHHHHYCHWRHYR